MILTITYEKHNATDLGYLLLKNPYRPQKVNMSYGSVYVFYPEISDTKCTIAMMLDINSINLVRKMEKGIFAYVNDRPYTSSSFFSVALVKLFGTALSGVCKKKPELVDDVVPLNATITMVPTKNFHNIYKFFEPLGYDLSVQSFELDKNHPEWGNSNYYNITISKNSTVKELLRHLYVLIPALDSDKHYYVSEDEIDKLERYGEGWLQEHPDRELIISQYLIRKSNLVNKAVRQLINDEITKEKEKEKSENKIKLDRLRINAVLNEVNLLNPRRVIDVGCGEGKLLKELIKDKNLQSVTGVDVSYGELEKAKKRLKYDELPDTMKNKINLIQGSLTYIDERFKGYDVVTIIEVIEHMDEERLWAFENNIFGFVKARNIIVTTPNKEYNQNYGMREDNLRHEDHRFEWTGDEFEQWCNKICDEYGYSVVIKKIGKFDDTHCSPTQMGVFTLCT